MATVRYYPSSITSSTGLTGAVTNIDEDVTAPDTLWLTNNSTNANNLLVVAMSPTPSWISDTTANNHTLRAYLRCTTGTQTVVATISVSRGGSTIATSSATNITSTTGQTLTLAFTTTSSSEPYSVTVTQTSGGSGGTGRAWLEVGAVDIDGVEIDKPSPSVIVVT